MAVHRVTKGTMGYALPTGHVVATKGAEGRRLPGGLPPKPRTGHVWGDRGECAVWGMQCNPNALGGTKGVQRSRVLRTRCTNGRA
jgi:hypothetical protein